MRFTTVILVLGLAAFAIAHANGQNLQQRRQGFGNRRFFVRNIQRRNFQRNGRYQGGNRLTGARHQLLVDGIDKRPNVILQPLPGHPLDIVGNQPDTILQPLVMGVDGNPDVSILAENPDVSNLVQPDIGEQPDVKTLSTKPKVVEISADATIQLVQPVGVDTKSIVEIEPIETVEV